MDNYQLSRKWADFHEWRKCCSWPLAFALAVTELKALVTELSTECSTQELRAAVPGSPAWETAQLWGDSWWQWWATANRTSSFGVTYMPSLIAHFGGLAHCLSYTLFTWQSFLHAYLCFHLQRKDSLTIRSAPPAVFWQCFHYWKLHMKACRAMLTPAPQGLSPTPQGLQGHWSLNVSQIIVATLVWKRPLEISHSAPGQSKANIKV